MSPLFHMLNSKIDRLMPVPNAHTLWHGESGSTYQIATAIGRQQVFTLKMQVGDPAVVGHNGATVPDLLEILVEHTAEQPELQRAIVHALIKATKE